MRQHGTFSKINLTIKNEQRKIKVHFVPMFDFNANQNQI